jgi:acyl-coenzyme A thioesterase PaaI-like protein
MQLAVSEKTYTLRGCCTARTLTTVMDEGVRGERVVEVARHHEICFGCGRDVPHGLRMELVRDPDGSVAGPITLRRELQGPPGFAHGGIVACVLDEAASLAATSLDMVTLTSGFEVRLRRATPVEVPLWVRASVDWADDRAAEVLASLSSQDRSLEYATCRATLVVDLRGAAPNAA